MKKYYPEVTLIVVPKTFFEGIERQRICRLIPYFECTHFPARLVMETKTYIPIEPTPERRRAARQPTKGARRARRRKPQPKPRQP